MLRQFAENFLRSEFAHNKSLQRGLIVSAIIIATITMLLPGLREGILAMMKCLILVGGPITILCIYDGILEDKPNDDES